MKKKYITKSYLIPILDNPELKRYELYIEYFHHGIKDIRKYNKSKKPLENLLKKYKLEFEKYNEGVNKNRKKSKEIEKMLIIQHNSFVVDHDLLKRLEDSNEIEKQLSHMRFKYNSLLRASNFFGLEHAKIQMSFFEGMLMLQYDKSIKYLKS